MEGDESAGRVPRELREKLKKARGAKALLQDLEEEVRRFVAAWEAQFLTFMREQRADVRNRLLKERKLQMKGRTPDDDQLNAAIADFQHQYKPPGK